VWWPCLRWAGSATSPLVRWARCRRVINQTQAAAPVSKTAIPMPYPHARNDCGLCGRYDADVQATFLGRGGEVQWLRR
jgi:hypothetical protein